ncbi:hypothetical protein GFS24_06170 [Chitinophaga sp. SYP-B3965]|uniref:hypothetical protein n=1 Tax=Chitinophaga sp. SYP-B3965 TaxID=2663120 RepID=UPI0012998F46|nr:hypothetical protein [Chitinophaga sp. SYP-B3965]MRG44689.1 hypothetical protein [Chitinophaga sp. SYP-B3965]
MKRLILLQLFILTSLFALGQEGLKSSQVKANLLFLGASASYEKSISRNISLNFEAGLNYGFVYSYNSTFGGDFGYTLAPNLSAEARHYYNLDKRLRRGKSITNNSGNFLSLALGYTFTPIAYDNAYNNPSAVLTPSWGMQRGIGKRFSFELLLGFSLRYDSRAEEGTGSPAIGAKIGYIIY